MTCGDVINNGKIAYEGQRHAAVGSRGGWAGYEMCEHHVGTCHSLGRVDRSWCKRAASRHFLNGGTRSPDENFEVLVDQNLPHG